MPTDPITEPVVDVIDDTAITEQPEVVTDEVTAPAEEQAPEVTPEAEEELTPAEGTPEETPEEKPEETPPVETPPDESEPDADNAPAEEPPVVVVSKPIPASVSKEVLRSVFNKRTVRYVDDAHWSNAVQAVKDGFEVTFIKREPYLAISQTKFDVNAKSVGVTSLNTLLTSLV